MPPYLGDTDGGINNGDVIVVPCQSPAPGCPCAEAGATYDCGKVYRIVGTHVDCAEGSMTCEDDGGWGACLGPTVYDGG